MRTPTKMVVLLIAVTIDALTRRGRVAGT